MKRFDFHISAEQYTYSFFVENIIDNDTECVVTSELRLPKFKGPQYYVMGVDENHVTLNDFQEDFHYMVNYLENARSLIELPLLREALFAICKHHINRFNRLLFPDLLYYVDLYTIIYKAVFDAPLDSYMHIHEAGVYRVLEKYPKDVLFRGPWGKYYSWADMPENE